MTSACLFDVIPMVLSHLEKYRNLDPRVNYDSFETNRGFQENLHKLLAETNAKFCMILSDEDRIDVNEYKRILSFLENLSSNIFCSYMFYIF